MQGRKPLHCLCHPISFDCAKRNGSDAPKKTALVRVVTHSVCHQTSKSTQQVSREVNDSCHQNRALLPAVAATLRVEAERRFAAGVPSISRQCRERSEATHGRRCGQSFTIRDWNLSITQSLVKTGFWLCFAPKRFSLWKTWRLQSEQESQMFPSLFR